MSSKIFIAGLFSALSLTVPAHAQYMGLEHTALTEAQTPVMFENAVRDMNMDLVKSMLADGFSLEYDYVDLCSVRRDGSVSPAHKENLESLTEKTVSKPFEAMLWPMSNTPSTRSG